MAPQYGHSSTYPRHRGIKPFCLFPFFFGFKPKPNMFPKFDLVVRGFTPEQGFPGSFRSPPSLFFFSLLMIQWQHHTLARVLNFLGYNAEDISKGLPSVHYCQVKRNVVIFACLTHIKGFRNIEDDHPASLQKITDDDLANSISNYIEVKEIVKMSPYQSFFHHTKIKYHSFLTVFTRTL